MNEVSFVTDWATKNSSWSESTGKTLQLKLWALFSKRKRSFNNCSILKEHHVWLRFLGKMIMIASSWTVSKAIRWGLLCSSKEKKECIRSLHFKFSMICFRFCKSYMRVTYCTTISLSIRWKELSETECLKWDYLISIARALWMGRKLTSGILKAFMGHKESFRKPTRLAKMREFGKI